MKQLVTNLFIVFLALLVFYGGAGVNLVSYCCHDCEAEGVEVLLDDMCCEIHEHVHAIPAPSTGESIDPMQALAHDTCCDVERVNFDWNRICAQMPELLPAVCDLLFGNSLNVSLVPLPAMTEGSSRLANSPPVLLPRIYLSLLTSLLI